jgi:hypothetical protein
LQHHCSSSTHLFEIGSHTSTIIGGAHGLLVVRLLMVRMLRLLMVRMLRLLMVRMLRLLMVRMLRLGECVGVATGIWM